MDLSDTTDISDLEYSYVLSTLKEIGIAKSWRDYTTTRDASYSLALIVLACITLQVVDSHEMFQERDYAWNTLLYDTTPFILEILGEWLWPGATLKDMPSLENVATALFGNAWWDLLVPENARTDADALVRFVHLTSPEFVAGLTSWSAPVVAIDLPHDMGQ